MDIQTLFDNIEVWFDLYTKNIDPWLGSLANVIGFFGIIFTASVTFINWRKDKQMQQEIRIELFCKERDLLISLPVNIQRKNFSRAEVLGYLGMIVVSGTRYELKYTGELAFFEELQRIQNAKTPEKLIIPCSPSEITQFEGGERQLRFYLHGSSGYPIKAGTSTAFKPKYAVSKKN